MHLDGLRCDLAATDDATLEALVVQLPELASKRPRLAGTRELAGVEVPGGIEGISFAPTLTGKGEQKKHEQALSQQQD